METYGAEHFGRTEGRSGARSEVRSAKGWFGMAAWDGVPVDDSSDDFLYQPGQDPVDEPDECFVVDPTDPTGVDQAGAGAAELVAWTSLPEPAVAPAVIGYPADEMASWHLQEHPDTCAVVTQEFILDGLTGVDHTESELLAVAQANGWYTPGTGTSMEDMGKILDYYGLPPSSITTPRWTTCNERWPTATV